MIDKITVCICDICGMTVAAKAARAQYNETTYSAPDGWTKGHSDSVDICPECQRKLARSKLAGGVQRD